MVLRKYLLVVLLALFSFAGTGLAQTGGFSSSYSWQEFGNKWNDRQSLLRAGDYAGADEVLTQILTMKELASWDDLFTMAKALNFEARYQEKHGHTARAALYYQVAAALAPHDAANLLALSAFNLRHNPTAPATYIKPFFSACALPWQDWLSRQHFAANMLVFSLWMLVIFGGLFIIFSYFRHLKTALHDYNHLFPLGTPHWLSNIFFILLLLLPPVFELGPFWYLLFYGLFIWWSMCRHERFIYTILLAAMLITTLLLPNLVSPIGAMAGSRLALYQAAMDPAPDYFDNSLLNRELAGRQQDARELFTPDELFVLGVRALKSGNLSGLSAQGSYEMGKKYLQYASHSPMRSADSYNALGIAYSLQNNPDDAAKNFLTATKAARSHLEANFNMARYYYSQAKTDEAQNYMRQATAINNSGLVTINDIANKYGAAYYAYSPMNYNFFPGPDKFEIYYNKQFLVPQVWSHLAIGQRSHFIFATLGLWLLAFALTSFLKVKPSRICPRCGRPSCTTCYPGLANQSFCFDCYQAEASRYASEEEKQQRRQTKGVSYFKYMKNRDRLLLLLSLIMPPATLFIKGRRRSYIYMAFYTLTICLALFLTKVITLPFAVSAVCSLPLLVLAILLYLICLIGGLVGRKVEAKE